MNKYFIAIYTNEVKSYADEPLFKRMGELTYPDKTLNVIDNSLGKQYYYRLQQIIPQYYNGPHTIEHLQVSRADMRTLFHRNVTESVLKLREKFLASDANYMVIIESDVIPPTNLLELFEEVHDKADIIGGIYYGGFHEQEDFDPNHNEFVETHHALSGCTLYSRKIIETIPFRWDPEGMHAFPDAWICYDAKRNGNNFSIANYRKIKCQHLWDRDGSRGHNKIR